MAAARKANTEAPTAQETRAPTFDLNDPALQAIIAQAVAVALAAQKHEGRSKTDTNKTDQSVVRAFEKKGFKNVVLFDRTKLLAQQPDVTVLTYNKWLELGRKVKPGEHAVAVKQFRLFHKDQTAIMTTAERKAAFQQAQAKADRKAAKATGEASQPAAG